MADDKPIVKINVDVPVTTPQSLAQSSRWRPPVFQKGYENLPIEKPKIDSVNPQFGTIGTVVTITGTGFGYEQDTCTVQGFHSHLVSWEDDKIVIKIPVVNILKHSGVGSSVCPIVVGVKGKMSDPINFLVNG